MKILSCNYQAVAKKMTLIIFGMIPLFAALTTSADEQAIPVEPKILLRGAEFHSHTNGETKDKETGVYVYVTSRDGKTKLAEAENADGIAERALEYKADTDHVFQLRLIRPGVTKAACEGFKVKVKSKASGNDNWEFKGRVTLYFSDGTHVSSSKEGLSLNSKDSKFAEADF
ncbi:MAG: hypothetical protein JWR26_3159 [Pedosphaera sp.]|nr:hypothetical protein [Pedosphaera sp.]